MSEPSGEATPGRGKAPSQRVVILKFIRKWVGVPQGELARRAGVSEAEISRIETGRRYLSPADFERLVGCLGVRPEALEDFVNVCEEIEEGPTPERWIGPVRFSGEQAAKARAFGRRMGKVARESLPEWLQGAWNAWRAELDREKARELAPYLRGCSDLMEVVRTDKRCHLWSVAEWLCQESLDTIVRNRKRAHELAEAALAVAALAPGSEEFKLRLGGYCCFHIGNVLRAEGELKAADLAFERAKTLWQDGAAGDPNALLDAGRVMGLEGSLRRAQGRFAEALGLFQEALPIATSQEWPYLTLNHGSILELLGDSESAIRVLKEASPRLPRNLLFGARFHIASNLVRLGRPVQAEAMLPEIAQLAMEQESVEYLIRFRWLNARVVKGLGKAEAAREGLEWVTAQFLELRRMYDAALASLEVAAIQLELGETVAVRRLVHEMAPVFVDVGVHVHAQEALRLFQAAVERETASVELVARVITYLERARRAPGLRFEGLAA